MRRYGVKTDLKRIQTNFILKFYEQSFFISVSCAYLDIKNICCSNSRKLGSLYKNGKKLEHPAYSSGIRCLLSAGNASVHTDTAYSGTSVRIDVSAAYYIS